MYTILRLVCQQIYAFYRIARETISRGSSYKRSENLSIHVFVPCRRRFCYPSLFSLVCVCVCVFRWTVNTIGDMRGFPLPYTQNYDASGICSLFHHRQRHGTSEVIALSLSHVKHTEGAWYSAVHKVVFNSTVASLFAFFLYYSETAIS